MSMEIKIVEQSKHLLNVEFSTKDGSSNLFIMSPEFAAYTDYSVTKSKFPFLKPLVYEIQEGIILMNENSLMFYCILDFETMLKHTEDLFLDMVKALIIKCVNEPNKFHGVKEKPTVIMLTEEVINSCRHDELLLLDDSYASSNRKIYN